MKKTRRTLIGTAFVLRHGPEDEDGQEGASGFFLPVGLTRWGKTGTLKIKNYSYFYKMNRAVRPGLRLEG